MHPLISQRVAILALNAGQLLQRPGASASPAASRWFEQHDRDGPLARPLLVHLVAVVVVIDQPPQFRTLGAFGLTRANRDVLPADLDLVTASGCARRLWYHAG